jgi:hypothetical protein
VQFSDPFEYVSRFFKADDRLPPELLRRPGRDGRARSEAMQLGLRLETGRVPAAYGGHVLRQREAELNSSVQATKSGAMHQRSRALQGIGLLDRCVPLLQ